jgi:hypothetical protein
MPKKKEYDKKENGKNATGRPSKLTEELIEKLEIILEDPTSVGLTDEDFMIELGLSDQTMRNWLNPDYIGADVELKNKFFWLIKRMRVSQKRNIVARIQEGDSGWQGSAWIGERKFDEFNITRKVENNTNLKIKEVDEEKKKKLDDLLG